MQIYSVQEVVEIINNRGEDIDRIYIEPPEATVLTDEDSADEDTGGLIDNLTGRQLWAGAHVVFADRSTVDDVASDDDDNNEGAEPHSIDDDVYDVVLSEQSPVPPPSHTRKHRRIGETRNISQQRCSEQNVKTKNDSKKQTRVASNWTQDDLATADSLFPEADYTAVRFLSPVDVFELMFSDDVWKLMVTECIRYALFLNCADPKVSVEERNGGGQFSHGFWTQLYTMLGY